MSPETAIDGARAQLNQLRNRINTVAEPLSREGTMSDALVVMMMSYADLVTALATATDLKSAGAAVKHQAALVKPIMDGIADGTLRFPFQSKQVDAAAVIAEFIDLNKGVSAVFEQEGWASKSSKN
ncbi:MAG: hypothetical protein EPN70_21500 [Paraburkholderia sp.]|uniref:hypothetical protein n=1 Tax=Paraburkholderia sp. TaxID=1926495 RepID=UPI0012058CC4|nr:hypothetical protein [Paraburkholderia sp.]TAM00808.1 MAG: hypothetical protein EPN70_21500 [Paraburkholderia sp.]